GDRGKIAGGGEEHADEAGGHAADGALQGDGPHPPADVEEVVQAFQRAVHDDRAGGFGGDVAAGSEGDADGGGGHGGGVVDAVPEVERGGNRGFFFHEDELFLGALAGVNSLDADQVRQILNLARTVATHQHQPIEMVPRPQM